MKVVHFDVMPRLPGELESLREIAFNLSYCWNWDAVRLFIRMDPEQWEETYQNPALMLGRLPQKRLEELAKDESFLADMKRVHERFKAYMEGTSWFKRSHPELGDKVFAYFSTEYGIDVSVPIYSGGLGALAGDHLKSASDLGLPLVAVGLLYREGYHSQYLTADGWQQERYPINDWYNMPVQRACGPDGKPARAEITLADKPVTFDIWKVQVGRIPLYLLDTDLPGNPAEHRAITQRLYVGDRDMRLRQEILLGVGGVRALAALGHEPCVCHMNEGHSAFMAVERVRQLMAKRSLTAAQAREIVWATTVFTTHTPVPAGNERFDAELVKTYMGPYVEKLGLSPDEFIAVGRENPSDQKEDFCLTVLALRYAAHNNGVSELHGETSRKMWNALWPGVPADEVPISSITNGVHAGSWLSHEMTDLFDRYLGPKLKEEPMDFSVYKRVEIIPDAEVWRTHEKRRERLVWFARKRLFQQLVRRGAAEHLAKDAEQVLDPQALTIGFARRFAAYKRATLLLSDPERLKRLLCDSERPVQLIIAGKAHPMDNLGKQMIKEIIHFIRGEDFRHRIVFLEDYDLNVARYLVQGADIWLNTPRRPLEASGTSGMKAAMNGALNLSTYDGWWCEGYSPEIGWVIGSGEEHATEDRQDEVESATLYDILEHEVIPQFYDRGRDGLPHRWIAKMKRSMQDVGAQFNTHRMVGDYLRKYYLGACGKFSDLTAGGQERAKSVSAWRERLERHWGGVQVEKVGAGSAKTVSVGDSLTVTANVRLGKLRHDEVEVQVYHGHLSRPGELDETHCVRMEPDGDAKDGLQVYKGELACRASGRRGFTVRVLPYHPDCVHPYLPGLIRWA